MTLRVTKSEIYSTMSMPEVHTPTKAADPAVDPMATANETSKDPIPTTGTDSLTPENRPDVASSTTATTTAAEGAGTTGPTGSTAPNASTVTEAQPISEGILNYRAPGLVK